MTDTIHLPHLPANQVCYDLVQAETPELWQRFETVLLPLASSPLPADARMQQVLSQGSLVWEAFMEQDDTGKVQVVHTSWFNCVRDLAAALVDEAILAIQASSDPVDSKRERMQALLTLYKSGQSPSFSTAMMVLRLQQALNELA